MSSAADPVARIAAAMDAAMSDPNSTIPVPLKPPAAWFRELPDSFVPPPEGPLVQIDMETGRVAALVAPYGECILDGRSGCWKPGMSKTNYEYAHVGSVVTAEGETVRTANVGGGINHFDVSLATAASLAADHYANTATRRMYGRYMDVPDVGIVFVGSMYPGTTYMHAFEAMTSALSGDWRWIESLRDHEMVGSQLVNNPGFRPNPLNRRPVLAAVSFRSAGAKVASAADCDGATAIISEWEPVVVEDAPADSYRDRFAAIEAVTAAMLLDVVEDAPMLPEGFADAPIDPVSIMDLDEDGDEGEDWAEEFADLTDDECKGCRGVGCDRCGWMGYTGPDDEAMVAALRANEAMVAKLMRRREKARDGDGDGFVYDSTPRQRPVIPGLDIIGENVSLDIIKRAASGDSGARRKVAERARANADLARKRGETPTARSLSEATLGPRPKDRAGARAWDELAVDVSAVAEDPDRIPGGRNPIEGRRPRTPTEVDVDRAAKARAQGRGMAPPRERRAPEPVPDDVTPVPEVKREGSNVTELPDGPRRKGNVTIRPAPERSTMPLARPNRSKQSVDTSGVPEDVTPVPEVGREDANRPSAPEAPAVRPTPNRLTRAEARRSRGGRDEDGTPADPAPVLRAPNGRPISNPAADVDKLMDEYRAIREFPQSAEVDIELGRAEKKLRDLGVDPEAIIRAEKLPEGVEYVHDGGSPLPFAVSRKALDVIKGARSNEDNGDQLALLIEAPEGANPTARFVDPDKAIGLGYRQMKLDGITFAVSEGDVDRLRGKRLESPNWGSGVVFADPDMPSAEWDPDSPGADDGWRDRETPSKMKMAEGVDVSGWDDERLQSRLDELNELIDNGGGRVPPGTSPRNEFARRAAERDRIAAELQSRSADAPEALGDNPFAQEQAGGESGGIISDIVEGTRRFLASDNPGSLPDTTGRNSRSTDVPTVGEGGEPVDSIPGGETPRPQLRTRDRGPATPGASNVDRTGRNPGAPVSPSPAEVQMGRGVPEAEAIEATRPPRPRVPRQPTIGPDQRAAGEQWREDRGLLSPGLGINYLGDSYPGEPGPEGKAQVEWDPRKGAYVRTTATGGPSLIDVDAQRKQLERLTEKLPGTDNPAMIDARADALNEVLRGVGDKFPLLTTKGLHNKRGASGKEWTAEREAVHDELILEILDRVMAAGVPADRMALFTGGLPGSGKSFALKPGQKAEELKAVIWELSDPNPPEVPEGYTLYVAVNSDYIKERMAELGLNTGIAGLKPMEEASLMHSESSHVGAMLEQQMALYGFNIAFDGTMGNEGKMRQKMQTIEDQGYAKPKLVFADITVAESQASAAARYRRGAATELGGRFVPSDVAEDNASRMGNLSMNRDTANFLINEGLVAEAVIVDNRGVSNAAAETVADLDINFPIPKRTADNLGLRYSDTPNADGTFNVMDPELGGATVKADFSRVDGRVTDSKWAEYQGVVNPEIGPGGYPSRSLDRVRAMPGVGTGTGTKDDPIDVNDVNTAAILLAEGEYQIKLDRNDEVGTLMDRLKELVDEAKKQGRQAPTYDLCRVTVPDVNLFCAENIGYDRIQMPQLGTLAPVPGSVADQLLAIEQVSAFLAGRKIPDEVNLSGYFMDHLRSRGIEVEVVQTPARKLKASQRELNGAKVAGMVDWKERAQAAAPKIDKLNKRLDAGDLTPAEYISEARKTTANVPEDGTEEAIIAAVRPQAVWEPRRIITTSDDYIVDGHHGWASDVAIDYAEGNEVMVESYRINAPIVEVLAVAKEWAEAVGSPAQGAGGYGADGMTEDMRRFRRSRRRTRVPSGGGPLRFPTTSTPITPLAPDAPAAPVVPDEVAPDAAAAPAAPVGV